MMATELTPYRRYCIAADAVIALHDATLALGAERLRIEHDSTLNPTERRKALEATDAQYQEVPVRRTELVDERIRLFRAYENTKARPVLVLKGHQTRPQGED